MDWSLAVEMFWHAEAAVAVAVAAEGVVVDTVEEDSVGEAEDLAVVVGCTWEVAAAVAWAECTSIVAAWAE